MALSHTPTAWLSAALVLAGCCVVAPAVAAADDPTCVSKVEFKQIESGMSISKLQQAVHGLAPFADTAGKGKHRYRWYVACEDWEPDLDVAVRYHQPVVGRRTVTKKQLEVYVAPA